MGYWKWMYNTLKMIRKSELTKFVILVIVIIGTVNGISIFVGTITQNIFLVITTAVIGLILGISYCIYYGEDKVLL